jgi:hypothetical protein
MNTDSTSGFGYFTILGHSAFTSLPQFSSTLSHIVFSWPCFLFSNGSQFFGILSIVEDNIEEEWDSYVEQLSRMGLEEYTSIHQKGHDIYWNN